jgi:NADPH:quinone reductase-like Zn-dependent oxidoreductase
MKAIVISRFGGPDVLQVREFPDPTPNAGEVRVRVKAAGLNFSDVMARKGLYPDAPKPPTIVGYEASGIVDALGEGVTTPAIGTRVIVLSRFNAQAELICAPARQVFPLPEEMSFEEGAALPVTYLTAYHMLFQVAGLRQGRSVLVHMAAGGVGVAVVQLCKTIPNVTVFGTASAGKHAFLRELGCANPIDYHSKDYVAEVNRLTNGQGVDIVLDPLGGGDWKKGYSLLRPGGHMVCYGFSNIAQGEKRSLLRAVSQMMRVPFFTPLGLMDKNRSVAGVNVGHLWGETELLRGELEAILALYRQGSIKPHIDSVIPFAEAAKAHGRIESRANVGKVLLVP